MRRTVARARAARAAPLPARRCASLSSRYRAAASARNARRRGGERLDASGETGVSPVSRLGDQAGRPRHSRASPGPSRSVSRTPSSRARRRRRRRRAWPRRRDRRSRAPGRSGRSASAPSAAAAARRGFDAPPRPVAPTAGRPVGEEMREALLQQRRDRGVERRLGAELGRGRGAHREQAARKAAAAGSSRSGAASLKREAEAVEARRRAGFQRQLDLADGGLRRPGDELAASKATASARPRRRRGARPGAGARKTAAAAPCAVASPMRSRAGDGNSSSCGSASSVVTAISSAPSRDRLITWPPRARRTLKVRPRALQVGGVGVVIDRPPMAPAQLRRSAEQRMRRKGARRPRGSTRRRDRLPLEPPPPAICGSVRLRRQRRPSCLRPDDYRFAP